MLEIGGFQHEIVVLFFFSEKELLCTCVVDFGMSSVYAVSMQGHTTQAPRLTVRILVAVQ